MHRKWGITQYSRGTHPTGHRLAAGHRRAHRGNPAGNGHGGHRRGQRPERGREPQQIQERRVPEERDRAAQPGGHAEVQDRLHRRIGRVARRPAAEGGEGQDGDHLRPRPPSGRAAVPPRAGRPGFCPRLLFGGCGLDVPEHPAALHAAAHVLRLCAEVSGVHVDAANAPLVPAVPGVRGHAADAPDGRDAGSYILAAFAFVRSAWTSFVDIRPERYCCERRRPRRAEGDARLVEVEPRGRGRECTV